MWRLVVALLVSGCVTWGPRALPELHEATADSIARSLDRQLLLNLVRLRYHEPPLFVDVAVMTTQQSVSGSLGLTGSASSAGVLGATPALGGAVALTPTTVLVPLQGEAFARRLLTPLSLDTFRLFAESGWPLSRLMRLTVDRAGRIRNARGAGGPTPLVAPDDAPFRALADAFEAMQRDNLQTVRPWQGRADVVEVTVDDQFDTPAVQTVRQAWRLPEGPLRVTLGEDATAPDSVAVRLRLRSVLGVLFYASQQVEVPPEHEARGLVTITRTPAGARFDWSAVAADLLRVRASRDEPADAFLKVRHRGVWFHIADDDVESKKTFLLLSELFNLQAPRATPAPPALMMPLGR
jgi:hypothetical protein